MHVNVSKIIDFFHFWKLTLGYLSGQDLATYP